jgi:peptidoglycan/xylan/chitin deacetylase (PgdA/CDA1 family)
MDVSKKDEALGKLQETLGGVTTVDSAFDLLSWDEIYCLHRTGLADFGSHTHTHQILSRCDLERQRSELCISRDILQQKLGKADLFAYPNGGEEDFTELTTLLVKELGYRCGLTTIQGLNSPSSNLYELRRVGVGANHSLADFEMRLLGL